MIAFHKGTVKHIFFIAETKGTMETLNLKPIEKAKIDCARKLLQKLSGEDVVYDSVEELESDVTAASDLVGGGSGRQG